MGPPAHTKDRATQLALLGGAEEYVRDSIHASLGLPVSDRCLRLKLLASEDQRRRLQDYVLSLEEDLRAAQRRIDVLKSEAATSAAGIRRCVEEKEAMAAAYADLSDKSGKECRLYERGLERAMEACDDLVRENADLRARARLNQKADLAALMAQVQELQKHKEILQMNLDTAETEVFTQSEGNIALDDEIKRLLGLLEMERQRRSEGKKSASTSTKNKRKSSSLRDGRPSS